MTPELMTTLSEHTAGNLRVLATMGNEMLALAARRELPQLDQKLYFEAFTPQRALQAPLRRGNQHVVQQIASATSRA